MSDPVASESDEVTAPRFPPPREEPRRSPYRKAVRPSPDGPFPERVRLLVTRPDPPGERAPRVLAAAASPEPEPCVGRVPRALRLLSVFATNRPQLVALVALSLGFAPIFWLFWMWILSHGKLGSFAG
jgi:hypothetical protein